MKHGADVAAFERAFAQYVKAKYAIAMTNGTVTMEVALRALTDTGFRVHTTPLTMAATSIAILNSGGFPHYRDIDPATWLLVPSQNVAPPTVTLAVSLFGLHAPPCAGWWIDDAAETLRDHDPSATFTSYSFQRSKILQTGEGGMLVTDSEILATRARSIGSLGYQMAVDQPRIDPAVLKSPTYARHHLRHSQNTRMNDLTAREGLRQLHFADTLIATRRNAAALYATAFAGFEHLATPQHVPEGWTHDYWTYAVKLAPGVSWSLLAAKIERHGGERPYAAWRLTFDEPAFTALGPVPGGCQTARHVQPRLMLFQTNSLGAAAVNAKALRTALRETRA